MANDGVPNLADILYNWHIHLYTPWSFSFVPQTFHTLNQVLVDGKACSLSQTVTQV